MRKSALLMLALGIPLLAANDQQRLAPACGPNNISFTVSTDKTAAKPANADANSAAVYIIQDDSLFQSFPSPTVRTGLDGEWVGATHGDSYFMFSVAPGEHHLCFAWQSKVAIGRTSSMATAHSLNAKAGETLYFKVRNLFPDAAPGQMRQLPRITVDPIDPDEGQLLTNRLPLSISRRKK